MVMSSPQASQHVPDSYWTDCLVQTLKENVSEFEQHKEYISVTAFIDDYSKVLVSFGIRGVSSKQLDDLTFKLINEHSDHMSSRSIENLMFYIDRSIKV